MLCFRDRRWRGAQLACVRAVRSPVSFWRRWKLDLGYYCVLGVPPLKQAMAPHAPGMLVGNRTNGGWISGMAIYGFVWGFLSPQPSIGADCGG